MANMEKIIRPHLPANIAPADTTAKAPNPPNTIAQFQQAPTFTSEQLLAAAANPFGFTTESGSIKVKKSTYSYYSKKYMKKREKETSKDQN